MLNSLEVASDGLLASGNSLSIAVRGLLKIGGAVVVAAYRTIVKPVNVGTLMNR